MTKKCNTPKKLQTVKCLVDHQPFKTLRSFEQIRKMPHAWRRPKHYSTPWWQFIPTEDVKCLNDQPLELIIKDPTVSMIEDKKICCCLFPNYSLSIKPLPLPLSINLLIDKIDSCKIKTKTDLICIAILKSDVVNC